MENFLRASLYAKYISFEYMLFAKVFAKREAWEHYQFGSLLCPTFTVVAVPNADVCNKVFCNHHVVCIIYIKSNLFLVSRRLSESEQA